MAKSDYIPPKDSPYRLWHDKFKAGVTANIATFGLVAGDATTVNAHPACTAEVVITATP